MTTFAFSSQGILPLSLIVLLSCRLLRSFVISWLGRDLLRWAGAEFGEETPKVVGELVWHGIRTVEIRTAENLEKIVEKILNHAMNNEKHNQQKYVLVSYIVVQLAHKKSSQKEMYFL